MKVAVIGAGFCGLSAVWHLLQQRGVEVDLFDAEGIGKGASGIASGLLHPYPGEQGRRSALASEGLVATCKLLQVAEQEIGVPVADLSGIVRLVATEEQRATFHRHAASYGDVEHLDGGSFLIRSGMTVYVERYLEGLWRACARRGAGLHLQRIGALAELKEYDLVILAAGAGMVEFQEAQILGLKKVKGQILTIRLSQERKSTVGKGYLARDAENSLYHLGATYEREFADEASHQALACELLWPYLSVLVPEEKSPQIVDCRAAVRVRRNNYMPFVGQLSGHCWAVGGAGSRGLLYHALAGEQLIEKLWKK